MTDAVLTASRALVAVAARSLAKVDDSVTLPQFRALVVLSHHDGECSVGQLADALDVHSSTTTRLCDRLVARRLVRRSVRPTNRRETVIVLTDRGRAVVDEVTAASQRDRADRRTHPGGRADQVVTALQAFSDAAGGTAGHEPARVAVTSRLRPDGRPRRRSPGTRPAGGNGPGCRIGRDGPNGRGRAGPHRMPCPASPWTARPAAPLG
ncbi:MAG: MarR family winged helix-turn-helix transcriptional regulator [Ilumatobacteraceae bacterium]